ncbi:MAG: CD225/dispanin family protein [Muribaculaceae bacterium]|nr:CD225/dispanin family protein [Muribaculaceae bacterium]
MTDIIILTSGDAQRAHDIAGLFEGGNRIRVVALTDETLSAIDPAMPLEEVWLVIDSPEEAAPSFKERFGGRVVTLAPHRTAPEAAADIIAAIRGAAAPDNDPDAAWAKTLGLKYEPGRIPGGETSGQTPPPIPQEISAAAPEQPQGSHTANPHGVEEPMPPTYLVWSVVMTVLCCLPAGVVAIVFSSMVSSKYYAGDIEGAKRCSRRAEIWIIASFVAGVLWNTLYIPMVIAGWGN